MNEGEPYVCLIDMIRSSGLTGWAEGKGCRKVLREKRGSRTVNRTYHFNS